MISRMTGQVESLADNVLELCVNGVSYEILIPTAVMKSFDGRLSKDARISLVTYHYYQTDPSKSIPVLIGFAHPIEKEFFERFITVSGVGPKAAVKALKLPIPDIAEAIDAGDLAFLRSLPGIGEQRGKEIIAKLQGKMGKFGLMQRSSNGAGPKGSAASIALALQEEAVEVLLQLQYKKEEAKQMVQKAAARKAGMTSAEEILNEVYRQSKEK